MKAEISNIGFVPSQNYSSVWMQQGRMLVDRDWNELSDILLNHLRSIADQSVGTGSPRHGGLIDANMSILNDGGLICAEGLIAKIGRDVVVKRTVPPRPLPGNFQVPSTGNRIGVLEAMTVSESLAEARVALYWNQLDLPNGLRVSDEAKGGKLYATTAQRALLYVDVWERTVVAFEDLNLLDPALHGADTCFRTQRMAQLKIAKASDILPDGDPCLPRFNPNLIPAKGNAEFTIALVQAEELADNCDPCSADAEIASIIPNELFRLEVQRVDYDDQRKPIALWLAFSSENGARQFLPDEPRPTGYSYEYFSAETEKLMGMPSDDWVSTQWLTGVLDPAQPTDAVKILPMCRQWDGWVNLALVDGAWTLVSGKYRGEVVTNQICKINSGSLNLILDNRSLTLTLANKTFLSGDYWLAVGRSRAVGVDRYRALSKLPLGIQHHYLILGEAEFHASVTSLVARTDHDKRRLRHPSLTCLDASDLSYNPKSCAYLGGTTTVEAALDKLCARNHWALRMSAGTGQEGYHGETLSSPIELFVEDQDGKPVQGAKVILKAVHPGGNAPTDRLAPTSAPTNLQIEHELTSDANGYVYAFWQINGAKGVHSVQAKLKDPPQGPSGDLWYTAKLIKGARLATVLGIRWIDSTPFGNDLSVTRDKFAAGFEIELSQAVAAPTTITDDILIVAAERINKPTDQFKGATTSPWILTGAVSFYSTGLKLPDDLLEDVPDQTPTNPASPATPEFIGPITPKGAPKEANQDAADTQALRTQAARVGGLESPILAPLPIFKPQHFIRFIPNKDALDDIFQRWPHAQLLPGKTDTKRFRIKLSGRFTIMNNQAPLDGFVPGKPAVSTTGSIIDLDFTDPGMGHASDFEAWCYVSVTRPVDAPVLGGGVKDNNNNQAE